MTTLTITCDNAYHDRGHGVCSFCVQTRIDNAVKAERQRCIDAVAQLERLTQEGNNDFQYSRVMAVLTRVRYAIASANSQEKKETV